MGYEIHIERPDTEITLEEWRSAVEQSPDVRLADGDTKGQASQTGSAIVVRNKGGDAEVLVDGTWMRALYWSGWAGGFPA